MIYLLVVLEARPLLAARVFAAAVAVSVEAAGRCLTGRRRAKRRLRHPGKLTGHFQKRRGKKKQKRKEKNSGENKKGEKDAL